MSCDTREQYEAEIRALCETYRPTPAFTTIDPEKGVTTHHYQDRDEFLGTPSNLDEQN